LAIASASVIGGIFQGVQILRKDRESSGLEQSFEDLAGVSIEGRWQHRPDGYHSGLAISLMGFSSASMLGKTVRLEFTRNSGVTPVAVFFRHPSGFGSVVLDAYRRGLGGIEVVDGETLIESLSAFPFEIEDGRRYLLEVRIEEESILVSVDGVLKQDLHISDKRLTIAEDWKWDEEKIGDFSLVVGVYKNSSTIHSVRVSSVESD